jgi:hypothetical protein
MSGEGIMPEAALDGARPSPERMGTAVLLGKTWPPTQRCLAAPKASHVDVRRRASKALSGAACRNDAVRRRVPSRLLLRLLRDGLLTIVAKVLATLRVRFTLPSMSSLRLPQCALISSPNAVISLEVIISRKIQSSLGWRSSG